MPSTQETMPSGEGGFSLEHTTAASGDWKVLLKTENTFVDQDIGVTITTPAATAPTLAAADITSAIDMGSASNGTYSPTATITGNVNIGTAGWITGGNHSVSDTGVKIGTVNQSTLKNGNTTIASGTTITPTDSEQTINISEGYNTARTVKVGTASTSAAGEITSGSATISSVSAAYNSTNSNFDITGSATVSAPTVDAAGYISSTKGTRNTNPGGATVAATLPKIGIQANLSGTGTKTPSIAKDSNTNIAQAGTATTTKPSSGYYVAVKSAANTGTVTATATVATAGYGTTTSGQYTTTDSSALTVGANASSVTYIPITQATYANTASSGVTYTDISSSAPALISGSYLFINAGYAPNQKISLAKLVPDATGANASSDKILSGFTAYDNNGALITGNIPTYTGLYEVV